MRAIKTVLLFGIAMVLAYVAGWAMAGTELSAPAAVASFASLALAVA